MTRRDRAAMELACLWLRASSSPRSFIRDADFNIAMCVDALDLGDDTSDEISASLVTRAGRDLPPTRLLRARLALYLRAVLRADLGDFGPRGRLCLGTVWTYTYDSQINGVSRCGSGSFNGTVGGRMRCRKCNRVRGPICALWEQAPEHRP